jgi:hypothetical protein
LWIGELLAQPLASLGAPPNTCSGPNSLKPLAKFRARGIFALSADRESERGDAFRQSGSNFGWAETALGLLP